MMTRREAIRTATLATAACATILPALADDNAAPAAAAPAQTTGPFTLPALPYAYDALEPHIDERTMRIHHDKHHQAYVTNLNKALAGHPELADWTIEDLMLKLHDVPENIRTAVQNNGGGHYNHSLFWQMMRPGGGPDPYGDLAVAINKQYGDYAGFKQQFAKAAMGRFGSGWAWLVLVLPNKILGITSTANQDTPLTPAADGSHSLPLLGLDVWEHAYYLKYQNLRAEYVTAFFSVINWDFVNQRYHKAVYS
jgi:Fe-Mn family superoxide dismutase